MAATSGDTFPMVARMGLFAFVGLRGMDIAELRGHLQVYRQTWRDAGHPGEPSVHLRIPLYAGRTEKAAREEPYESIMYYFKRQAEIARSARRPAGHRAGRGRAPESAHPRPRGDARVQVRRGITFSPNSRMDLRTRSWGTPPREKEHMK